MNTKTISVAVCALALAGQPASTRAQSAIAASPDPQPAQAAAGAAPVGQPTQAAAAVPTSATVIALDNTPLSLDLKDAELNTALGVIQKKTGVQIVLIAPNRAYDHVTLSIKDRPAGEALQLVAAAGGADLWQNNDTFFVGPKGSAPRSQSLPQPGNFRRDALHDALSRPIDIQLKDATVRQAADALRRAAGVSITVDSSVPRDLRLNVEADHVPLVTILEGIGQKSDLMIGRDGDTIELRSWPSLNVNGQRSYYKGANAPWGDEWGGRPGASGSLMAGGGFAGGTGMMGGFFGGADVGSNGKSRSFGGAGGGNGSSGQGRALSGGGFGAGQSDVFGGTTSGGGQNNASGRFGGGEQGDVFFGGNNGTPTIRADGSVIYGAPAQPWEASSYSLLSGAFHMTALGDKLVIAEPGLGSQGETGVILTVYQWDSGRQELRRISSTFHRADGGSRRSRAAGSNAPRSGSTRTGNRSFGIPSPGMPSLPPAGGFFGGARAASPPSPGQPPSADRPDPTPEVNDVPTPGEPDLPGPPAPGDPGEPL